MSGLHNILKRVKIWFKSVGRDIAKFASAARAFLKKLFTPVGKGCSNAASKTAEFFRPAFRAVKRGIKKAAYAAGYGMICAYVKMQRPPKEKKSKPPKPPKPQKQPKQPAVPPIQPPAITAGTKTAKTTLPGPRPAAPQAPAVGKKTKQTTAHSPRQAVAQPPPHKNVAASTAITAGIKTAPTATYSPRSAAAQPPQPLDMPLWSETHTRKQLRMEHKRYRPSRIRPFLQRLLVIVLCVLLLAGIAYGIPRLIPMVQPVQDVISYFSRYGEESTRYNAPSATTNDILRYLFPIFFTDAQEAQGD